MLQCKQPTLKILVWNTHGGPHALQFSNEDGVIWFLWALFGAFLVLISIPFRSFSLHLLSFRALFALRGRFWVPLDATIVLMFDPRLSFWQSRLHFLALVERPCAFEPMKTNVFRASTKVVYHTFFSKQNLR